MTEEQITLLAAHIRASVDPAVVAARDTRNDTEVARLYNLPSNPSFFIWRKFVSLDDVINNNFDWVLVDNLSVGKARIWEWLFSNSDKAIDATKSSVRAGIAECWKGTAAMLAQQSSILNQCKRTLSVGESVFATGLGTTVEPGETSFEGTVTIDHIGRALNSPIPEPEIPNG